MANKTKIFIVFLILVIVVLAGIMTFSFLIKPKLTGYATSQQLQGANNLYNQLIGSIVQCPPEGVSVPVGNQTIHLVAVECYQQPQQQQAPSEPAA